MSESPSDNQQCLKGILNEETTTCDIKDIGSEEIIKEIEQRHIIVFNTINRTITSTCGRPKRINGSAIITFKNCSININGLKYDDIEIDYTEEYILSIPELEHIKINNTINDISLHKLHLQTLNTQNGIIEMKILYVTHLTAIYVLLALFAIMIGIVCTCKTYKILFTPMETPSDELPTIPSLWPSLHTRGEELPSQPLHFPLRWHPPNRIGSAQHIATIRVGTTADQDYVAKLQHQLWAGCRDTFKQKIHYSQLGLYLAIYIFS